jgi:Fur family zinc uptake transcriptional regulator
MLALARWMVNTILAANLSQAYIPPMHAHDHKEHRHHEHHGADLTQAAQATLEKAGEQWTAMRASIFAALAGFDKPASAYDIAEAVSKAEGRRQQRLSHP